MSIFNIDFLNTEQFKKILPLLLLFIVSCSPIPAIRSPKIRGSNVSIQFVKDFDNGSIETRNDKTGVNDTGTLQFGYNDYFYLPYVSLVFLKRNEVSLSLFPFGGMASYKLLFFNIPYNNSPLTNINCALIAGAFGSFNLATDFKSNVNSGLLLSSDILRNLEFIIGCNYSVTQLFDGSPVSWDYVNEDDTIGVYYSYHAKTKTLELQTGIEYTLNKMSFTLGFSYPIPLKIILEGRAGKADFTPLNIAGLKNPLFYYWRVGPSIQLNISFRFKDYNEPPSRKDRK